jgi:hypothetical protein
MAMVQATRTAAVLTSLRNAAIAISRRTAIIAVLRSRALIIHPRLARTVHRPRARTQNRGRTPRPGLILRQPGAIRRRPVPIPHQAKVTAVVVATEVAVAAATEEEAAAVVAAEVLVAGVPLRIRRTKFISQLRARSGLPSGLSYFRMGYFKNPSSVQVQYVGIPRTQLFLPMGVRQSRASHSRHFLFGHAENGPGATPPYWNATVLNRTYAGYKRMMVSSAK